MELPLPEYKKQALEEKKEEEQARLAEEARKRQADLADDEDEYFQQMLAEFQKQPRTDEMVDDDIAYFQNHPLSCKELSEDMLNQPEFKAL